MSLLPDPYLDPQTGEFEDYRRMVNASALRLGIVITVAVQVPFLLFEWMALREQFFSVQLLRALWLLPAVALYPFSKRPSERLLRRVDGFIWLIYVASAAYIVVVSFLHEGYQSPYIDVLILMFVGVGAVTLWHLWFALGFALAIYGLYWLPLLLGYGSTGSLINWIGYQCFLIGTMGIVLISQQLRMRMARADFDRRCQLEEEKRQSQALLDRVDVMQKERLNWLESLARFLRHELKNQMVAIGTSIDMIEQAPPDTPPERYLSRARRSLGRMNSLVRSATEATSLEAALAAEEMDQVDLSGVVMDRVTAFQELHPSRHFSLKLRPGLSIDGNEARLAQLLDKLLSNAVEHSVPEAEIRVGLRRLDADWLELSVENDGDTLPKDKTRLFEAFVSTQKSADNLGLGLFVAQSIVLNHGGEIRGEDLLQGGGARFVARLPRTGTEGRVTETEEGRLGPGEQAQPSEDQPPQ